MPIRTHLNNLITLLICSLVLGLTACGKKTAPVSEPSADATETETAAMVETGETLTRKLCSGCHTLNRTGKSPRPDAPPLRVILADYNAEALGDNFREHIHVGHPDMPDFDFNVKEADAILAYLKSIQTD